MVDSSSSSSSSDAQQPVSAQEQERRSMDAAMEAWLVRTHVDPCDSSM
jgi:hypothetical protein